MPDEGLREAKRSSGHAAAGDGDARPEEQLIDLVEELPISLAVSKAVRRDGNFLTAVLWWWWWQTFGGGGKVAIKVAEHLHKGRVEDDGSDLQVADYDHHHNCKGREILFVEVAFHQNHLIPTYREGQ